METITFVHVGNVREEQPYGKMVAIYREMNTATDHYMLVGDNGRDADSVYIHFMGNLERAVKRAKEFIETGD